MHNETNKAFGWRINNNEVIPNTIIISAIKYIYCVIVPLKAATLFTMLCCNSAELKFMRPDYNPFVKAFESTAGRGLAGVLGSMSFSWYDENFPWEIDFNSRAPRACKISLSLDVIHDIPPGIDHAGYNRAPVYNVGNIMKDISGDVYEDSGVAAAIEYRATGFAKKLNPTKVEGS